MALVRAIHLLYGPPASPGSLEEETGTSRCCLGFPVKKKRSGLGRMEAIPKVIFVTLPPLPVPAGEVEREGLVRPGVQDAGAPGNLVLRAAVHHQGHGGLAQNGQEGRDQIPLGGCVGWQEGIYLPLPLGT